MGFAVVGAVFALVVLVLQIRILCAMPKRHDVEKLKVRVEEAEDCARRTYRHIDNVDNRVGVVMKALSEVHGLVASGKANSELLDAVRCVAACISENTYKVFVDLIAAVETNDAGRLSGAVRSAKHLCAQYDAARGAGFGDRPRKG